MAEPQRASALPDALQRPHRTPKPRPPHPPRYAVSPRLPLDATQDLSPTARAIVPEDLSPIEPEAERPAAPPHDGRTRQAAVPRLSSRSPGEWVLMAIVLLGLALNVSSQLANALSRSDRLLGSAVLLVGLALLVLMEVCRRTGHPSR